MGLPNSWGKTRLVSKNSPDTINNILEIKRDRDPGGLFFTPIVMPDEVLFVMLI